MRRCPRPRDERPVASKATVSDERVQVRMPVGPRAMRLQTGNDTDGEFPLAGQRADGGRDGAGGDAGDLAEQRSVQRRRPDCEALGVATRAEVPALAREDQQILVRAGVAPDALDAVLHHATGEECVGDLRHHETPRAIVPCNALEVPRLDPGRSSSRPPPPGSSLGARCLSWCAALSALPISFAPVPRAIASISEQAFGQTRRRR